MNLKITETRTKIVCTIGPASCSEEVLSKLIDSGMDVARLNFSHGTHEEHTKIFDRIRSLSDKVGIMFDITGPKVRTGEMKGGKVFLENNSEVVLTKEPIIGDESKISVSYNNLPKEVEIGESVFINDGLIELKVLSKTEKEIACKVITGGAVGNRKGVNIPGASFQMLSLPTEKDLEDLKLVAKLQSDFVSLSFVKESKDVEKIRNFLADKSVSIPLISKIELKEAVENFDEILKASEGIMVARGDMGIQLPPWQVPIVQKSIIKKCNIYGKPVITATQMLESMTYNPRPTRAEASDVANAILDGTDAVMLSTETATGKYPIEAVKMMDEISSYAECLIAQRDLSEYDTESPTIPEILGHAVHFVVKRTDAAAVIVATQDGYSARLISKYRPPAPIIAVTPEERVMRQLAVLWAVTPLTMQLAQNTDALIYEAVSRAKEEALIEEEDTVVIVAGSLLGIPGKTNLLEIHKVKDVLQYRPKNTDSTSKA